MKVKIDIFSGFLGAGKTLLIKKLISTGAYKENIAIIENEFGEVSIDSLILRDTNIKIREINSGCICCEVTGDFKEACIEVIEKYKPDRIIIEPSGVAKLTDIIKVFKEVDLRDKVVIENLITVINPEKYDSYITNFKDFYIDQIKNAKKIVISRVEKVDNLKIDKIIKSIRSINSKSEIIKKPYNELNSNEILSSLNYEKLKIENSSFKASLKGIAREKSTAKDIFESYAIYPKNIFSKAELNAKFNFIASSKAYGDIIRAKGVINLREGTYGQFDYAGEEFELREMKNKIESVISFIGVNLNKEELKKFFS
ncbi:GTP-binding protein [Clostridium sartagoforme]|uniref:GTP-binding protein n=1 Tax=Clostridium sartagoforme TaxID=84031 RepID=A0A4S2DN92_9CLOT|nr:GTP-binding protein [Clostridium sartagoforme]TGY43826.1 GTP-binding protein [Clostridium sartagoforme]